MNKRFHPLTDAAEELGVTSTRLRQLCQQGRIRGAKKMANAWFIPKPYVIKMDKKDANRATKLNMKAS